MLNLYWTRYWLTPVTDTQDKINLVTARAFITTILSDACKFEGGFFGSFSKDIVLAGKLIPDSILSYFLTKSFLRGILLSSLTSNN